MAKARSIKASFQQFEQLRKDLASTDHPLVCLYGTSECLLEYALDSLRLRAKSQSVQATTLEGSQLTEAMFESITSQPTLFESSNLYVVRRAEQSKSLSKSLKILNPKKKLRHKIVFIWGNGEPTAAVSSELRRLEAFLVPCMDPWPNEVPQVIQAFASGFGLNLDAEARQTMIEANGNDLIKHRHELHKIALLQGDRKVTLTKEDIAPLLGLLRQDDSFQLDRLLIQRQWPEAHALADALITRGEKALGIVAILANHCRNVIRIEAALSSGCSPSNLQREVRLPPFMLKAYIPVATRADIPRYIRALRLCQSADLALKSTSVSESLLVAQVIEALTTPP